MFWPAGDSMSASGSRSLFSCRAKRLCTRTVLPLRFVDADLREVAERAHSRTRTNYDLCSSFGKSIHPGPYYRVKGKGVGNSEVDVEQRLFLVRRGNGPNKDAMGRLPTQPVREPHLLRTHQQPDPRCWELKDPTGGIVVRSNASRP